MPSCATEIMRGSCKKEKLCCCTRSTLRGVGGVIMGWLFNRGNTELQPECTGMKMTLIVVHECNLKMTNLN